MCLWVAAVLDRRAVGGRCPPWMLPGGSFWLCLLGGPPQWVLRTLLAQMARLLQVAPLARVGRYLHFCTKIWIMLALLAGMLLLALWARLGCCPHLTVTLLARLARMSQEALLAQMNR